MPRGFAAVNEAVKDIEARKNSVGSGDFKKWFKVADGESIVVRFIDTDTEVKVSWTHEIPVQGQKWGRTVPCRDQDLDTGNPVGEPCPGCEQNMKRKFKGWINLIWRDAPVFKKDENGRLVKDNNRPVMEGVADQVAVWNAGFNVFEELSGKEVTYRGITSRDFRISRRGSGLDTRYTIEPADPDGGPQPMSESDKKLAAEKYDLTDEVTPPSYEAYFSEPRRESQSEQKFEPADVSPFRKTRGE